ncbi:DUF2127 domain-containing protein [Clostridium sp. WILCCON 0269]|uniref:DUF2127 domain-containing protein n=1 Tax=Candidatus Clostridium eludens TaxID=3381663 RepID=A0ABW8SNK3_9CLOT
MIFYKKFNNTLLRMNIFSKENNVFHKSFKIGILLKGIDGVLEIIGGILLVFLNPSRLNKLVALLTQHELLEDPKDFAANFAIRLGLNFSVSSQHFGIFYLISHGIIKLFFVTMLWKRKIWAYPLTIVSLLLFILYQIYHYMISHSAWLMVLTIFDIIMIMLILIEYKFRRNNTAR